MSEKSQEELIFEKEEKKFLQKDTLPKDNWKRRRKIINATLIFCAFCITYIMFLPDNDKAIFEIIVLSCFGLAGSVIASYIGFSTQEDNNKEKYNAFRESRKTRHMDER